MHTYAPVGQKMLAASPALVSIGEALLGGCTVCVALADVQIQLRHLLVLLSIGSRLLHDTKFVSQTRVLILHDYTTPLKPCKSC